MSDSKIKVFVTEYDDKLYLQDKTEYPITVNGVNYERDEVAVAVAYSYDDFAENENISLFNDTSIPLNGGNGDIVSLKYFYVPLWESGIGYADNQIIFYEDLFYKSDIDGNAHTPNPENQNWTVLTNANALVYLMAHNGLGYPIMYVEMYSDIPITEPFSINKLLDAKYEILNNTTSLYVIRSMKLYDYEDNYLYDISDEFEVADDGVYKAVIRYDIVETEDPTNDDPFIDKSSVGAYDSTLIITHVDSIECCYKKMIQSLYCKGSDYCLSNDCFKQRETEYKLNEISNIYNTLLMNMQVSRMQFYNVMTSTDSKEKYVQEVGRLVKMIGLMINDCKNCCDD